MSSLFDYLVQLNSSDSGFAVYVNPRNPEEEYRIGQVIFENGGLKDGWVKIGTLDQLSFGFQYESDAFSGAAAQAMGKTDYNEKALYDAYTEGRLDKALEAEIRGNIKDIHLVWSEEEANGFICDKLPQILVQAEEDQLIHA